MPLDLDRLAAALEQIEPALRLHARTVVTDLQAIGVQQARQSIVEQRAVDTGRTLDGITATDPQETDRGWTGEVRAIARQSIFVERGRRIGAPMPPGGALLGWMNRHGIPLRLEFVIRRNIARRGIPARPFMRPLRRSLRPDAALAMREAAERIRVDFQELLRR